MLIDILAKSAFFGGKSVFMQCFKQAPVQLVLHAKCQFYPSLGSVSEAFLNDKWRDMDETQGVPIAADERGNQWLHDVAPTVQTLGLKRY